MHFLQLTGEEPIVREVYGVG